MSKLALNQQLWNAAIGNNLDMVEAALTAGADPDFRDTTDPTEDRSQAAHPWSVMHESIRLGHTQVAEILLRHGAEQACDGLYSLAPLHVAALLGHEELVSRLLASGGDANIRSGDGSSALMAAFVCEDPYDFPGRPIQAKHDDKKLAIRLAQVLIKAGCPIDGKNEVGETPIWNAVRYQDGDTVSALIKLGANPHATTVFGTSLVAECADSLNRADALGQMVWRADECRTERQRALDVLKVLHENGVALVDGSDISKRELHYPTDKIQREIESWWRQWDKSTQEPSGRPLRR